MCRVPQLMKWSAIKDQVMLIIFTNLFDIHIISMNGLLNFGKHGISDSVQRCLTSVRDLHYRMDVVCLCVVYNSPLISMMVISLWSKLFFFRELHKALLITYWGLLGPQYSCTDCSSMVMGSDMAMIKCHLSLIHFFCIYQRQRWWWWNQKECKHDKSACRR